MNPLSSLLPPIDLVLNRFSNQSQPQTTSKTNELTIKQEPLWFDNSEPKPASLPTLSNEDIKRKIEDMKIFKDVDNNNIFDGVDSGFNSDMNSVGSSNFLFPDVQCDGLNLFDNGKTPGPDFSNQWMNFM